MSFCGSQDAILMFSLTVIELASAISKQKSKKDTLMRDERFTVVH